MIIANTSIDLLSIIGNVEKPQATKNKQALDLGDVTLWPTTTSCMCSYGC